MLGFRVSGVGGRVHVRVLGFSLLGVDVCVHVGVLGFRC